MNLRFDALLYLCNIAVASLPSARFRHWFYRSIMEVELSPSAHVLSGLWLDCRGHCVIGDHSVINQRCRLDNRGGIRIGANVSLSPEVHVLTGDHDVHSSNFEGRERPVTIEDDVFVGSRAIILPGVTLGKGCVVGAGAVVSESVDPFTIVAGNPARPIGERPKSLDYQCDGKRHFF